MGFILNITGVQRNLEHGIWKLARHAVGGSMAPLSKSRLRRNMWKWECMFNAYNPGRCKSYAIPKINIKAISIN